MKIAGKEYAFKDLKLKSQKDALQALNDLELHTRQFVISGDITLEQLQAEWKNVAELIFTDSAEMPPIDALGAAEVRNMGADFFRFTLGINE